MIKKGEKWDKRETFKKFYLQKLKITFFVTQNGLIGGLDPVLRKNKNITQKKLS